MEIPRAALRWLAILAGAAAGALVFLGPVPQPAAYHAFVDTRGFGGLPNALNVLSNVAFLAVGGWTCARAFAAPASERALGLLLGAGVLLTTAGSSWYHWAPSNDALVWDRLPMTLAFAALTGLLFSRHVSLRAGRFVLAFMLVLGPASVALWWWSEHNGHSDLRVYSWAQAFPTLVLLVTAASLKERYLRRAYGGALVGYALAKAAELFDANIFAATGEVLSGHTLKHLLAAVACGAITATLNERGQATFSTAT